MKIAACQFAVSGKISVNLRRMIRAAEAAAYAGTRLIAFPECALTGYPPISIPSSIAVDFDALHQAMEALRALSADRGICIVYGAVTADEGRFFNTAVVQMPDGSRSLYHKRALWGWDRENFVPGDEKGVFALDGWKIGVRICYEVRFPEFFRELYREKTDLNLILFFDAADQPDPDRYELIKAHIRTRACENVCHSLSVNTISPCQTAPTMVVNPSGTILRELEPGRDGLLLYDLQPTAPDFSESGRKTISDMLI